MYVRSNAAYGTGSNVSEQSVELANEQARRAARLKAAEVEYRFSHHRMSLLHPTLKKLISAWRAATISDEEWLSGLRDWVADELDRLPSLRRTDLAIRNKRQLQYGQRTDVWPWATGGQTHRQVGYYIDPENKVLRNWWSITNEYWLGEINDLFVFYRIATLPDNLPTNYELRGMQQLHWWLYQDVYPWAGQLRTVNLAAARSVDTLEDFAGRVCYGLLRDNFWTGYHPDDLPAKAAVPWLMLMHLCPFRQGSEVVIRVFLSKFAPVAGFNLEWGKLNSDDAPIAYQAFHSPFRTDDEEVPIWKRETPARNMFKKIIVPTTGVRTPPPPDYQTPEDEDLSPIGGHATTLGRMRAIAEDEDA
jgi:cell filamentation protein